MSENKRYYWMRLKENFFEDDTMDFIESQQNGEKYCLFYLKLCCKALKDEGKLIRYVGNTLIPYDDITLAKLTRTDIDTVRSALAIFSKIGLIEKLDTGELYLSQIKEMIGSECDSAERARKTRAKQKHLKESCYNVTDECYNVTEKRYIVQKCNTELELEKEKDLNNNYYNSEQISKKPDSFAEVEEENKKHSIGLTDESLSKFYDYNKARGWKVADWKAALRLWKSRESEQHKNVQRAKTELRLSEKYDLSDMTES